MPTTEFKPFQTHDVEELGKCLMIHAINAKIPDALLPRKVEIEGPTYHWRYGPQYYLTSKDGPVAHISFPDVPGDGEPSLRAVIGWLERHGYRGVNPDEFDWCDEWAR